LICFVEVLHYITLCLYFIVIIKTCMLLPHVKECPRKKKVVKIIYTYLICLIGMTGEYLYLQICSYDQLGENDVAWAIYDLTNIFAHFLYLLGLEVWVKWKSLDDEGHLSKRRRKEDF